MVKGSETRDLTRFSYTNIHSSNITVARKQKPPSPIDAPNVLYAYK